MSGVNDVFDTIAGDTNNKHINEQSEIDEFFDDADLPDAPADDLLSVASKFVKGYAENLMQFRQTVSEFSGMETAWDPDKDVIELVSSPHDGEDIRTMACSNNVQFNKIVTVFGVLCSEMTQLINEAETKFYGPLTMFGHVPRDVSAMSGGGGGSSSDQNNEGGDKSVEHEAPEIQMGTFLPFLQELENYISRVYDVVRNIMNQIACLYHERQRLYATTFKYINIEHVFEKLGELLSVPLTLDTIITDNPFIELAWNAYKRMIKYVRADHERYKIQEEKLRSFEGLLLSLDRKILARNIFEMCLSQDYGIEGAASAQALIASNRVLFNHMKDEIKAGKKRLTSGLGEGVETYNRKDFVNLYCLYALHRRLFLRTSKPDKSLYKQLWELQKKLPLVHLYARSVWTPAEFLLQHAPLNIPVNPAPKTVNKIKLQLLQQNDSTFRRAVSELYQATCQWMVRMDSEVTANKIKRVGTVLSIRSKLLVNGLLLAMQVRNLLNEHMFMHLNTDQPFIANNVRGISLCAEMLKAIEGVYHRKSKMISENMPHLLGQSAFVLRQRFLPIKKKLEAAASRKPLDDAKSDILAAVTIALTMLQNAPTSNRLQIIHFTLAVAQFKGMIPSKQIDEVRYALWRLDMLAHLHYNIERVCNTDMIYWVMDLLPTLFDDIERNPSQVHRLQYLFNVLRDPCKLLCQIRHRKTDNINDREYYVNAFKNEVLVHFEKCILESLSREVETNLRLHIHSVVLEQESLLEQHGVKDLSRFLNLKPLRFFDQTIDVKSRVTHYLDSMFYNLTTVTLHDWRLYAEMRNLAYEKYGLEMTEVHLPGNAHYSEALDVLEIMRNIHIFVARYNYNMNTQIFVERTFDQKHLNAINIQHISNSIRTHGIGIMNTTVNFTYQFLCRKFVIFSEFLFDDYIKSRLMNMIRYYKNEREELDNQFPWQKANKFCEEIRKLGVSDDGLTFLDQFRQQITEIGNAMGYIRMVRSGGMQYVSKAIKFVPDLEDIQSFVESVTNVDAFEPEDDSNNNNNNNNDNNTESKTTASGISLSPDTVEAAKNLDAILDDLSTNFAEGTEYYSVLVNIFRGVFQGDKQMHLRNFYMIVPPLMINFIDKMMAQKETLKKKGGRGEASFTDDGFALGIAYILALLNQYNDFDSLHWFDSISSHLNGRRDEITKKLYRKKVSNEDKQHYQLQLKRLQSQQEEFEFLFYSFSGARIFFRGTAADIAKEKEKAEAEAKAKEEAETNNNVATESTTNNNEAMNNNSGAAPPPAPPVPVGNVPPAPPMAPPVPAGNVPPAPPIPVPPPLP